MPTAVACGATHRTCGCTVMLAALKLSLDGLRLCYHSLLRRDPPTDGTAREPTMEIRKCGSRLLTELTVGSRRSWGQVSLSGPREAALAAEVVVTRCFFEGSRTPRK